MLAAACSRHGKKDSDKACVEWSLVGTRYVWSYSSSRSDCGLNFRKRACYVMQWLRRDAQLPRNLCQGEDAAYRVLPTCHPFDRVNHQGMLTAGEPQCCQHIADSGIPDIVHVHDFQAVRWSHYVFDENVITANAALLRQLQRLFAQ